LPHRYFKPQGLDRGQGLDDEGQQDAQHQDDHDEAHDRQRSPENVSVRIWRKDRLTFFLPWKFSGVELITRSGKSLRVITLFSTEDQYP
jgi:hypothetical protein